MQELQLPVYRGDLAFWTRELRSAVMRAWSQLVQTVRGIACGRVTVMYSATNPPTTGSWFAGDVVRNREPREHGSDGGKYVIYGWLCVESGAPGVWVELRCLTGN